MDRRVFLGGAAAALASPALGAEKASRTFQIMRDGDDIGTHMLDAVLGANGFEIAIDIRIKVKVLGITAYRYEMDNREIWKDGRIVSVNSTVNDDGTKDFAKATRNGDVLTLEGSKFNGTAPGIAPTTSYFATDFLKRQPWISTQTGTPLDVGIKPEGRKRWWQTSGELETRLGYDATGEWVGCEFDAGGELASYKVSAGSGKIADLWAAA